MATRIPWNDVRALRALADMQRQIAANMRDLACRMIMERAAEDTERLIKMDGGSRVSSPPPSED